MLTQIESVAFRDSYRLELKVLEELSDELDSLLRCHYSSFRISLEEDRKRAAVVWLKVLDNHIVRSASSKSCLEVLHPLVGLADIDSIHHCHLLIEDDIRVVAHAVRCVILALKEIHLCIIDAYVFDCIRNFHIFYIYF